MTTAPPTLPPPTPPPAALPFRYHAQTVDGHTFSGTLDAPSLAEAQARLTHLQLRILSLEAAPPAPPAAPHAQPATQPRPLGRDDFLLFNQQLAHLTQAGLPVERGLRLIAADLRAGRLASAANDVAKDLESGMPLRDAFERHARGFPPLYARLVDAGVHAGNLPAMLLNLGRHLELVARMRQALWRLFSYPLMLLAAALLVFYFICTVVLPQFAALYGTFELPLPGITAAVLALGAVYPYLFFGALALALVAVLVGVAIRATGRGGTLLEGLLLRVPLIGPVVRASLLARWIDALRIGIDAGLDLPRALALASDATASPRLAREAAALADRIATGGRATDFRGSLIPQTVPAAIDLGAAAGDLPATLGTLSDLYEGQAEHRLRMLPSIITPVMMVLLAVVICTGIAALFAPIIQYLRALGNVM